MTDLKRVSSDRREDVSYVWVRSRRGKKEDSRRPAAPAAKRAPRVDPMSIPWGDMVETPLRLVKRLFGRS